MTVHLLIAEHFSVPGVITKIFASEASADKEAVGLINIMLDDTSDIEGKPSNVDQKNWPAALEWLQDYHGAAHCYVEINAHEVIYPTFEVTIAWNDSDPCEGDYSTSVQAKDPEAAEQLVRYLMRGHDAFKREDFRYGRTISVTEAA